MNTHQVVINILRKETSEHLENFLNKTLLPHLKNLKASPKQEVLQEIQDKFDKGIQTYGTFYPLNRLWSEEALFTSHGLTQSSAQTNLLWSQKLLKALKHSEGWESAEQEICAQFGGYGFIPEEDYPPTLFGFHTMVRNLLYQEEEGDPTPGFATYLPEKIGMPTPANSKPLKTHPQSLPEPPQNKPKRTLSKNQIQALKKLNDAYRIFKENQSIGGISLRSPLLIGPSGGGKTTIVR